MVSEYLSAISFLFQKHPNPIFKTVKSRIILEEVELEVEVKLSPPGPPFSPVQGLLGTSLGLRAASCSV